MERNRWKGKIRQLGGEKKGKEKKNARPIRKTRVLEETRKMDLVVLELTRSKG